MAMLYTHSIGNQRRTRWWCLKCVMVYLARVIPAFVMYCVNGASRSSLLIESTDSMILLLLLVDGASGCQYMGLVGVISAWGGSLWLKVRLIFHGQYPNFAHEIINANI